MTYKYCARPKDNDEGETEYVHVFPLFGREHVTEGLGCWCHPAQDPEEPRLIIHNVEN